MLKTLFDKIFRKTETNSNGTSIPGETSSPLQECELVIKPFPSIGTIHALVIADGHGSLMQAEIQEALQGEAPDIVFFLGDNTHEDIDAVQDILRDVPMIGVHGNHDFHGTLEEHHIQDLHGQVIEWNGFTIGGFGGSIRYKEDSRYVMFTNEESEQIMSQMPKCDLLLTHDKPCFETPKYIHAHAGLTGIGQYIETNHPAICLHGHLHEKNIQMHAGGTIIRCCHRAEYITITI